MIPPNRAPCDECPWRRASPRGWLGPLTAEEWVLLAHSDEAVGCHKTIPDGISADDDEAVAKIRQCAGAAIYRSNVCKSPRDPAVKTLPYDREAVFASPVEFRNHHERITADVRP